MSLTHRKLQLSSWKDRAGPEVGKDVELSPVLPSQGALDVEKMLPFEHAFSPLDSVQQPSLIHRKVVVVSSVKGKCSCHSSLLQGHILILQSDWEI